MTTSNTTIDQNIITWALISPFGKVTSNFKTRLKNKGFQKGVAQMKNFSHFFPTLEKAQQFCKDLKTSKTSFSVVFITDKQFGEIVISY